ncbi:archease [Candidatus Woesearchaeota archaeon]|jgi:SHS2 domain-containing protein|nr:archease [Candidatus Woesearchaeota archaeon]MBT6518693.1 archease [Candidatus Woesearchaeota archaeon]MBT7368385.1 archease [Candidatus Woesearchaeota archaeon]
MEQHKERYVFFDEITSDVIFEAYGATLKDVFVNAAEAMFTMICKFDLIKAEKEIELEVEADNIEDLMMNWLSVLIAHVDIEEMFFSKFIITEISDTKLKAVVSGEEITPEKGETVVKAVTYYQYNFEKTDKGYKVRVSLDI